MDWKHPAFLMPERLVFLNFDGVENPVVIGYVGSGGVCEWPEDKKGQRPTGWQNVLAAQKIVFDHVT